MTVDSPHPWVDSSRFPLVIVTFPPIGTSADVRELTTALRSFAEKFTQPVALLSDLSQVRIADPDSRAIYTEFVRSMPVTASQLTRAVAVVVASPFQRAMFNLHALLVGRPPYQLRAFASCREALPWLGARLESSGR